MEIADLLYALNMTKVCPIETGGQAHRILIRIFDPKFICESFPERKKEIEIIYAFHGDQPLPFFVSFVSIHGFISLGKQCLYGKG